MQALLTFGRRRICCTPGRADAGGSWYAGGSLEARMYVGVPDISAGSGGIWTKWRISRRLSEELFVCWSFMPSFRVNVWPRTPLGSLRRASRRRAGIRRDRDRGVVFECYNRIRGYISLPAYLDSMVTDKRQVSSLFIRISKEAYTPGRYC
jgi:hypothetical protein